LSELHQVQEKAEETGDCSSLLEPITEGFTEQDLSMLSSSSTVVTHENGSTICKENHYFKNVYWIKSGTIRMYKTDKSGNYFKLDLLEAGEMFGELSLLGAKSNTNYVVESQEVELIVMELPFLNYLFGSNPKLCAKFYKVMATKLATKLKNLPTAKNTLETIGNTGGIKAQKTLVTSTSSSDLTANKSKNLSKADRELRQEFLIDDPVIKGTECGYCSQRYIWYSLLFLMQNTLVQLDVQANCIFPSHISASLRSFLA
jgi:CRP-like cAMP-binding protein